MHKCNLILIIVSTANELNHIAATELFENVMSVHSTHSTQVDTVSHTVQGVS